MRQTTDRLFTVGAIVLALLLTPAVSAANAPAMVLHNFLFQKFDAFGYQAPETIHDAHTDQRGRLWIAGETGLQLFDGNGVTNFEGRAGNIGDIPHFFVKRVAEGNDGTIWIGTWGGGVARFDEQTRKFVPLAFPGDATDTPLSKLDEKIWSLEVDKKGRLWIGTFTKGLFRYSPETRQLEQVFHAEGNAPTQQNRIESIFADSQGRIWFAPMGHAVRVIDAETLTTEFEVPTPSVLTSHPRLRTVYDLERIPGSDNILVAYNNRYIQIVTPGGQVLHDLALEKVPADRSIMEALPLDDERLLLGTDSDLWFVDLVNKEHFAIPAGNWPGAIPKTIVWDLSLSEGGDILVAGTTGVWIQPASARQFWTITQVAPSNSSLHEARALSYSNGSMFVNNGATLYKVPSFPLTLDKPRQLEASALASKSTYRPLALVGSEQTGFWVANDAEIFHVTSSGQWAKVEDGVRGAHIIKPDEIYDRLLVPAYGGLSAISPDQPTKLARFDFDDNSRPVLTVDFGRHNDIWTGTFSGIHRYDRKTLEPLIEFTSNAENSEWSNPFTNFLKPINDEILLIGTTDGLYKAVINDQGEIRAIHKLFKDTSLELASFSAIFENSTGEFIVASNRGIARLNPESGDFQLLPRDRVSPTLNPYGGSYFQIGNTAVLSGLVGPLLFRTDSLNLTYETPELNIADVVSFRGTSPTPWDITSAPQFLYEDKVIRFKFGLLDYINPEDNSYRLRLEGFTEDWLDIDNLSEFSFTNLNPGNYSLWIEGRDGGNANASSSRIDFTVLPPWWRTWWAYSLYVLLIFGSLFLYWLSLQRKIAREQEISTRLREADRIKSHFLNELESKVEDATQDLRHAVEALEIKNIELGATQQRAIDASRLKSEFLANMSHEIRTPMNGVLGFTQLLQKSNLDNDQRDYVETIDKSAKSLLGIINDVLDVSKIEAGKLIIDSSGFDLRECVADTLQALAPVAYDKNLELIGHVDPALPDGVRSDPTRLRQMLTNLVGNAIKFTDSGHVYVHVEKAGSGDGEERLRISVSDTGRGISAEDREKLFHAFERGSVDLAGRYTGTGLGLVITKKLCEAMGGSVELDSVPGKGTQVVLELPLVVDRNPENRYGFGKPLKNRRIVIIDPHTQSREALRSRLIYWGADVTALADVVEPAMNDAHLVIFGIERIRLGDTRGLEALLRKLPQNVRGLCMAASVDRGALRSIAEACGAPCIPKIGHLESQLRRICEALGIGMDAAQAEEAAPARLAGLHVLIADDNRINRYFLKKILELHGARVTEVDSGQGVLRTLDSLDGKVDIALLDVHMPDIDGLEVARRIRTRGNHKLPLLAVSANVQTETHEAAIAAGINDYLLKPVEEMKLVEAVLEWTGREMVTSDE